MRSRIVPTIYSALIVGTTAAPASSSCPETLWVTHYRPLVTVTVTTYHIVTPSWARVGDHAPTVEAAINLRVLGPTVDPAACPNAVVSTTTIVEKPTSSGPTSDTTTTAITTGTIESSFTSGASSSGIASMELTDSGISGSSKSVMSATRSTPSRESSTTKQGTTDQATHTSGSLLVSSPSQAATSTAALTASATSASAPSTPTQSTSSSVSESGIQPSEQIGQSSITSPTGSSSTRPTVGLPSQPTSRPAGSIATAPPSSSPISSHASSSGPLSTLPPSFWLQQEPTMTVASGGSFDLPCITLSEPTTIQRPPYTTSLCTPHCGEVNFQSKTKLKLEPITTTELCFMPLTATEDGLATAAFRIPTTTSSISAPSGMKACPPKYRNTDKDKKCGPDHHYTCAKKECCSKDGKCGEGKDFCDAGCRPDWGLCWKNSTTCTMPTFGKDDDDDDNPIPIFPIWYEDPPAPPEWRLPWPPRFDIQFGDVHLDCPFCGPIEDLMSKIWGIRVGDCGILGCDGIDLGWFLKPLPKLQCPALLKWICHNILKCCCCGAGGSGSTQQIECTGPMCDESPEFGLDNNGKLCDESLENCEDPPQESATASASCEVTSTVTDQTISCGLTTGPNGYSSQVCTSTGTSVREGCTVVPKTISVTTTGCQTLTATIATAECDVHTAINATASTECTRIRSSLVSGCTVSDHTTSKFTTSCSTTTATQMSISCGVITGANTTHTSCSRTQRGTITGCGVTDATTSLYNTQCSTTATVTNQGVHCFAYNATVSGSIVPGSATCTSTTRSVLSGCDVSATTTTSISTSELKACMAGAYGGITIEPFTGLSMTYASNTSSSSSACVYPTRSDLPSGRKVPAPATIVEGNVAYVTPAAAVAKRATDGATMTNGAASCYYSGATVIEEDIYPIFTCGLTLCPNELPSSTSPAASSTPARVGVIPRTLEEPHQDTMTGGWEWDT